MSTATVQTINAIGLAEIHAFLSRVHKLGGDHFTPSMLHAWADQAEFQLSQGNPACIEVRAADHIMGRTEEFEISPAGLDSSDVDNTAEDYAADYRLFCEYIDPNATTSEAEFNAMSFADRVSLCQQVIDANA